MRNLRLSERVEGDRLLEMLDRPGDLFETGRERGILPINFNSAEDGLVQKGQFLCMAETMVECEELLNLAKHDLPVDFSVDRD